MAYREPEPTHLPTPPDVKTTWQRASNTHEECAIARAWQEELKKPPHLRSSSIMMTCFCPKCRVIC